MTRGDFIVKWISYTVVLILVTVLNYHVLTFLPLGAVPELPLVSAVAVGVLEGPTAGAGFGLAMGLIRTGAAHGSAAWVFMLPLVGWICGLLTQYILRQDLVGYAPACLAASLLYELWAVLSRLIRGVGPLESLLRVAGPELLWTVVFSIPVYGMCHFCCKHYGRLYHG